MLDQIDASLQVQVNNAVQLSPIDTGKLKKSWKLERNSESSWTVKNTSDHAIFQEYGTYKQSGREMFGARTGRWKKEVVRRIK
ncbi:hypothetical protein RV18_GL001041 [Enterococcus termitis]|nr:hypothetical protein RV18_GL001041 [Enterococcus termitis]